MSAEAVTASNETIEVTTKRVGCDGGGALEARFTVALPARATERAAAQAAARGAHHPVPRQAARGGGASGRFSSRRSSAPATPPSLPRSSRLRRGGSPWRESGLLGGESGPLAAHHR